MAESWFSTFGRLELTRAGDSASGRYEHNDGSVQGVVEGRTLRGAWAEPSKGKAGSFELTFDAGQSSFRGNWKYDADGAWRGPWTGVRVDLPVEGDGRSVGSWNSHESGPLLAGPMVGEVGLRDARVWVQARDASALTIVVEAPDGREIRVTAQPLHAQWYCATLVVEGLEPGTAYTYRIESAQGATEKRRFETAPDEKARRARIAFGSCYDTHDRPLPIFETIGREDPDLLLMIGDNCYYDEPDWQNEQTMMLAQLRNRNNPSFRALGAAVPVLGIWDDHDFGPNDSDARFEGKETSLRVFSRVWAQRSFGLADAPGVHSVVRWGPVEMFLLDGRYERLARRQILGPRQLAWLEERLAASTAPIKLVVSGSQLLPIAAAEKGWECFRLDAPAELERLLGFVAERDIRGVVYISGDVHLGYLLHEAGRARADGSVGPETWELTSSPLSNHPWHETLLGPGKPHDPTIVHELAVENYGLVDIDLDRTGHEIHFLLKAADGRVLVDQPIDLLTLAAGAAGERAAARPERPPVSMGDSPAPAEGVDTPAVATLLQGRRLHLIRGDACTIYDLDARTPAPGSPGRLQALFPGISRHGAIDAAVAWSNGKAYFFTGRRYHRFDLASGSVDKGFPLEIARHWPGVFPDRVDAAILWNQEKAFFFRGTEYVRYDLGADRVDPGYPMAIAAHWPGVWAEGIDAAFGPIDGKAWFLRGAECIRWDVAGDRMDAGYPRAIAEEWPGLVG